MRHSARRRLLPLLAPVQDLHRALLRRQLGLAKKRASACEALARLRLTQGVLARVALACARAGRGVKRARRRGLWRRCAPARGRPCAPRGSWSRPTCAWWSPSPGSTWDTVCSSVTSSRRETSASCAPSRSSTTSAASSSPPTPCGGYGSRSRGPSPIRAAPSVPRCTWSRRATASPRCAVAWSRPVAGSPRWTRSPNPLAFPCPRWKWRSWRGASR